MPFVVFSTQARPIRLEIELASSLDNLANLYLAQGDYTQAKPLYLQV
ncbi:tetratricopeptide repeat protein [Funiculus sociatus]